MCSGLSWAVPSLTRVLRPAPSSSGVPGPASPRAGPGGRRLGDLAQRPATPAARRGLPDYDDGVLRITRIPGFAQRFRSPPPPAPAGRSYALAGEIDESTVGGLAGKLAEIAADLGEVHLDLAALDDSDLAGLRVIVGLAADGRRRGCSIRSRPT